MEQKESYGRRLWRMWGPLVIKFGIAYLVYVLFTTVFMMLYLFTQSGGNQQDIMAIMQSETETLQMYQTLESLLMDFAVPIEGVAAFFTIPVMLLLFYFDKKKEMQEGIERPGAAWRQYFAVPVLLIGAGMGLNNLIAIGNLSSLSESYERTMEVFYEPSFLVQVICLGLLMPVCEELVFRGLMFRRIRKQGSWAAAAFYSSFVFAVTHSNLVQFLYALAMGMLLAYVCERYGSVIAPVIGHIGVNCVSLLGTKLNWLEWGLADPLRIGSATVICAAVASTMYVLIQRTGEEGQEEEK